jgi:putative mRNA 3-end processing factor
LKSQLLKLNKKGLYCPLADVYIDPWSAVDKAVITHAHSDHARFGSKSYLAHHLSVPVMKYRLGSNINVKGIEYGKSVNINGVKLSLHPAGHIPGSAQVRLEHKGEVAVVSGDYKLGDDGLSTPYENIKCNMFVSESTFGLPIYKWKPQAEIFNDINEWWKRNSEKGKASVLCGYSLGKSQRILYNLDNTIGRIYAHGSIININNAYKSAGLKLPEALPVIAGMKKGEFAGTMILAPPSAGGSPWLKRFEPYSLANASGWMNIRGSKRRQAIDIGFALSDHADWNELNTAIKETGAENICVTHGFTDVLVRWLNEKGIDACELHTRFVGEQAEMEQLDSDEEVIKSEG